MLNFEQGHAKSQVYSVVHFVACMIYVCREYFAYCHPRPPSHHQVAALIQPSWRTDFMRAHKSYHIVSAPKNSASVTTGVRRGTAASLCCSGGGQRRPQDGSCRYWQHPCCTPSQEFAFSNEPGMFPAISSVHSISLRPAHTCSFQ